MTKIIKFFETLNQKYKTLQSGKLKKIGQFFPSNFYVFILSLILMGIMIPKVIENDVALHKPMITGYTDEIIDSPLEQIIDVDNIQEASHKIGILFATHARKNTAVYQFEFYEDNHLMYKKKVQTSKIKDNQYYYFEDHKIDFKKGKQYKFVINPIHAEHKNAISLANDSSDQLVYAIHKKSDFSVVVIISVVIFLIINLIINYLINKGMIKTEKNFLLWMLLYIVPILFIYPATQTPDEPVHFFNSVRLSQINSDRNSKQMTVPTNINCLNYSDLHQTNNVISKDKLYQCFRSTKNIKKDGYDSKLDKIMGYAVPATAIHIIDIFSNSPMIIFYGGRLVNFAVSFLILLYAMKQIPKHKKLFLLVTMLPMFIQQTISYSYDSLLNSLSILVISYLVKFYSNSEIEKKDLIIYTLSSIIILNIKAPYFLISLPILFINKNKFKRESKLVSILVMFGSILISYFIFKYLGNLFYTAPVKSNNNSSIGNTISSLFNIKHLGATVIYTLRYNSQYYLDSLIGSFGWLSFQLSHQMIYSYAAVLLISVFSEESDLPIINRIIQLILIFGLICGIFLAMYLYWTPRGDIIIEGVQGRYFLSPLLLFLISILPRKKKLTISNECIYSFINLSMYIYILTLLIQFY